MNAPVSRDFVALPTCLADLAGERRWVGWRWETRRNAKGQEKRTKPPFRVAGGLAHNDRPETWSTAGEVVRAMRPQGFAGIGLELLGLAGFAALDLDKVRDPSTGAVLPWAEALLVAGSYAEATPSGTGFRVLGTVAPGFPSLHNKFPHPEGGEVEFYVNTVTGRYITVTGARVDGAPDALAPLDAVVARLKAVVAPDLEDAKPATWPPLDGAEARDHPRPPFGAAPLPPWLRHLIARGRSDDRSADFQAAVNGLRGRVDFATALQLLEEHLEGPAGKYAGRLEAELRRSWQKAEGWGPAGRAPASDRPGSERVAPGAPAEPEDADSFDLSHDALATDLGARSWDRDARHVALWGDWLFWDEARWAKDVALEHMTRARSYLNARAGEVTSWAERKAQEAGEAEAAKLRAWAKGEARTLRHAGTVAAVVGLARSNRASAAHPDAFDANPMLLGTPGGTVDLATGALRPARREDMVTRLTSVAMAAGRPARWLAFLEEVFAGDREIIAFVQRAAGYSLTGETREHRLLFPYGGGANGKSTFLETLFRVAGDYARRIPAVSLLNGQGERHPTDLAGLRGARLVVGSELPRGKSWDESAIKDLTGGDVVTARLMRQDFFDFRPQFTLWIAGNTLPSFKGVDEALRRRVVLVPFDVTIPAERRDPDLSTKLAAEAGQILAWAIHGAVEWGRRGLDVPGSVAAASRDYLDGEDTLGQFLAEETRAEALAFVTTSALHERFRQWCDRQGLQAWTLRTLQKEVAGRGVAVTRRNVGAGFLGLRLA